MATDDKPLLVLPRPGAPSTSSPGLKPISPISAPPEALMTSTFGTLLPPAQYITTPHGRAAYYAYPLLSPNDTAKPMRILLIHGVQTPALGLHPLATALRTALPHDSVATFDHWGHGLSDTPVVPHEPELFFALMDEVLRKLGWAGGQPVHLVGYSFGGATAAGYVAARAAGRTGCGVEVGSLVLVAPAGLLRSEEFEVEARERYLPVEGTGGDEGVERAASEWVLEFLEGGKLVVPEDWRERVACGEVVAEAVKDWEMREHEGHFASVVAIVRDGGVRDNHAVFEKVAETDVRTLGVLGELDGLCSAKDLEDVGIKNVVVVPDVGHAVVRQRVPEVSRHIVDFWKSL